MKIVNIQLKIIFIVVFMIIANSGFGQSKISGIFDSGWSNYQYTGDEFKSYYTKLKALGINTVVYQFSLVKPEHEYYPSELSWAVYPVHKSLYENANKYSQEVGLDLYLALYYENTDEWWGTPDNKYLKEQADKCIDVYKELEKRYGDNQHIKGYYLPYEIARHYWYKSDDLIRLIVNFLKPITDYIHNNSSKIIIVSPFFNSEIETSKELKEFWHTLLSNWKPDIIAMQDGIGVGHATLSNVAEYLTVVADEAEKVNVKYWTNVELFKSVEDSSPANISRVIKQIETATPISSKVISFDNYVLFRGSLYNDLLKYQTTDIDDTPVVTTPYLFQNYPNPFNPTTVIEFSITEQSYVELSIFNSIGEKVVTLIKRTLNAGIHKVNFNASGLSSGIYFYKLRTSNFSTMRKMILLR